MLAAVYLRTCLALPPDLQKLVPKKALPICCPVLFDPFVLLHRPGDMQVGREDVIAPAYSAASTKKFTLVSDPGPVNRVCST